MRYTLICIGSMGDVRPYLLLGRELVARGHEVSMCAFTNFQSLIESEGMRYLPLSGDARDFMAHIMKPSAVGIGYLKEVRDSLKSIIGPFLIDLEAACQGAEAIVSTYFGGIVPSIAEVRHVPYIQTHYFPMDRNDLTPIASAPGLRAGKAWNKMSYKLGYLLVNLLEVYYLDDWRRAHGMTPRKIEGEPIREINGHRIPSLYAMSPLLMPRPLAWDENIHMTGFWVDEQVTPYEPSKELQDFLADGEKPVYIGFGSMNSGDMAETLRIVLESIRQSGIRAILAKGWGGAEIPPQENVFVADFIPHDWLFDRVAAVVHHGGAGTTAAGLLAGKPTLVIPFGGDQPFWAMRVRMLGVGPKPIRRDKLTVKALSKALGQLMTVKSYRVAARELGERLRMENGVKIAANIIEHDVNQWLSEDGTKNKTPVSSFSVSDT